MRKSLKTVLVLAALLAAFAVAGIADKDRMTAEQAQYCRMVRTWNVTDGQRGWPDFYGTYNTDCPKGE